MFDGTGYCEQIDWKQIRWLSSYLKSGSTWVRALLDAYLKGDSDINRLFGATGDNGIEAANSTKFDLSDAPIGAELGTRTYGLLNLVKRHVDRKYKLPLVVKSHEFRGKVKGVFTHPEELSHSVVYLVRDPRNVLPSLAAHFGIDIETALGHMLDANFTLEGTKHGRMKDAVLSWPRNVRSYLYPETGPKSFVVRYEDLQRWPEDIFTQILMHFGIPVFPNRVAEAVEMTKLDKLRKQEKQAGFKENHRGHETLFFGGKRQIPTSDQLERLVAGCGKMMKRLGYTV